MGRVKAPLFGFLTIFGLVGLDWEGEFDDDEFFFWMRSTEVDRKCSCGGKQELCDQVASGGSRHIGNGCNLPGSVLAQICYVWPSKSDFVFPFCLCVEIGLKIKICFHFCLTAKIILFSNNVFNFCS